MKTSVGIITELNRFRTSINKGIYAGNTPHISEWRTTSSNETVTLPYATDGSYTGIIEWGDGTQSVNSYANRTHTYATPGYYNIKITGKIRGFRFANTGDKTKIYRVFQWGNQFDLGPNGAYFYGCTNLNLSIVSDVLVLYRASIIPGIQNFANMFRECTALTTINRVNEWDVSRVISMPSCFYNCTRFNQSLNSWDIRLVTDTSQMFFGCTLFNGNITSWQPLTVTNMLGMFRGAPVFNQNIGSWNVLSVTNMSTMFYQATNFNQNIGNWDIRNVTNFTNFMFGKTFSNYSAANYDALLIGWASRPVKPNINISFNTIKRTAASTVSKLVLTSPPNLWTITDNPILA